MILKTNRLHLVTKEELSEYCGFHRDTIRKAIERGSELKDKNLRIFQDKLEINPEWWDTGKGDIYVSKHTYAEKAGDNKLNGHGARETFYTDLIENNVEYSLLPRAVLKDYKIVPDKIIDVIISSNENEKKALRESMETAKESLIKDYELLIKGLENKVERLEKENEDLRRQIPGKD